MLGQGGRESQDKGVHLGLPRPRHHAGSCRSGSGLEAAFRVMGMSQRQQKSARLPHAPPSLAVPMCRLGSVLPPQCQDGMPRRQSHQLSVTWKQHGRVHNPYPLVFLGLRHLLHEIPLGALSCSMAT